jgi:hypothetical protein
VDGLLLVAAGLLFCYADLDSGFARMAGMLLAFAGVWRANAASSYLGVVAAALVGAVVLSKALHSLFRPRGPGMWTVLARKLAEDRRRGRLPGG